jgi:hypothetical protein
MDVTYTDAKMTAKNASSVDSSWKYTFNTTATGKLVHLVVTSVDGTEVNAVIYIDGQQSTQNNSAGGTVNISAEIP